MNCILACCFVVGCIIYLICLVVCCLINKPATHRSYTWIVIQSIYIDCLSSLCDFAYYMHNHNNRR